MDRFRVSGVCAGDSVFSVYRHFHGEIHACYLRNFPYRVMDGITLHDSPNGFGMSDHVGVVKRHNGFKTRQPRSDHLGASREAGEEVRLDESSRYADVRLRPVSIQPNWDAAGSVSPENQIAWVKGIVIYDVIVVQDVLA